MTVDTNNDNTVNAKNETELIRRAMTSLVCQRAKSLQYLYCACPEGDEKS